MKKLLTFLLTAVMAVACCIGLVGCNDKGGSKSTPSDVKVGLICLHDDNSTYDKNFIDAMKAVCAEKGADLVIRTGIDEDTVCYDTAIDLVSQGCSIIFADSFGHEPYILQAAKEKPNVQFYHATGTTAHTENQANFHNAFADIYQGRFVAGYIAGLKLAEMVKDDTATEVKVGYVGAWPYAEVKSGYTSWFLGLRKAFEEETTGKTVTMKVTFTNSWYDEVKEKNAAEALIADGCKLISQHADSWGAPTACEKAGVPNVSYNGSTASKCPNTFLVSSKINWKPYFRAMIDAKRNNTALEDDWTAGFCLYDEDNGAVNLSSLGKSVAAGTAEKVNKLIANLVLGNIKVFDCSTFTVTIDENAKSLGYEDKPWSGKNLNATVDGDGHLTAYMADVDSDPDYAGDHNVVVSEDGVTYFAESFWRSAPYFDVDIDGISTLLVD